MDVTNASAHDVAVGWEFEGEGMNGSRETLAPPCQRESMPLSTISGDYAISVGGEVILEDSVPPGAGSDTFLVVRILIGADGEVEAAPPVIVHQPPETSAAIPCG